jgi:hypothetical protein
MENKQKGSEPVYYVRAGDELQAIHPAQNQTIDVLGARDVTKS